MTSYLEWIHGNWQRNSGPCADCVIRNCEFPPYYGDGVSPADIALVGQARYSADEIPDDPFEPATGPESHHERLSDHRPIDEWLVDPDGAVSRIPQLFWDDLDAGFTGESDNTVYFTNLLKCRPVDVDWQDDQARDLCSGYLDEELRRVDPDVVVAFGNDVIDWVYEDLDRENDGATVESGRVISEETSPYPYSVIPSVHWGYLGTLLDHIVVNSPLPLEWGDSVDDYWRQLAGVIAQEL
jgi:uracil-DNA glycosylase